MNAITEFIDSMTYQNILKEVARNASIRISEDKNPIATVGDIQQRLYRAGLDLEFISNYIQKHHQSIVDFSVLKISYYEEYEDEAEEEEYPEGEELCEDEKSKIIEVSGYSPCILMWYAIEYFFLKEQPDKLLAYIKALRIPYAAKYRRKLISFYKQVKNNH